MVRPLCTYAERWVNARETETGDIPKMTRCQSKGHYQHYCLRQRKRNICGILNKGKLRSNRYLCSLSIVKSEMVTSLKVKSNGAVRNLLEING